MNKPVETHADEKSSKKAAAPENGESRFPFNNPKLALKDRIVDFLSRLSLEEKIGLIPTHQLGIPRLGIEENFVGGEAAHGIQARDSTSTVFPQTLGLSQTWDESLMEEIGEAVGTEARALYYKRGRINGLTPWAPTVDMERDPRWGRTEEAYGEDPVLAGKIAGAYIRGMQGPDEFYIRCAPALKHFYANNNEELRGSCSASIDEAAAREYYRAVYEHIVRNAKVHSFMTAYNAVNGIPAMVHPDINDHIHGEWGFDGYIVCDGAAFRLLMQEHKWQLDPAQAIAASILAGIDCVTDDAELVRNSVRDAIERKLLQEKDLDRAVGRVTAIRMRLGQFDPPGSDPYENIPITVVNRKEHRLLARRAAEESIVLLKNDGILPLTASARSESIKTPSKTRKKLAVLGPLADVFYRDWYTGLPPYTIKPIQALSERIGPENLAFHDGDDEIVLRYDAKPVAIRSWDDNRVHANAQASAIMARYKWRDWGWGNNTLRNVVNGQYLSTDDRILAASAAEVWGWFVKERFDFSGLENSGRREGKRFSIKTWNGKTVVKNADDFLAVDAGSAGEGAAGNPHDNPTGLASLATKEARAKQADSAAFSLDLLSDGVEGAVRLAAESETALVFVGNNPILVSRETMDRTDIRLPPRQEALVRAVAAVNPQTVLVIVGSHPYDIGSLLSLVKAVLYLPMGGQESGNAIASVLFGDISPAGRLSMTWYSSLSHLSSIYDYDVVHSHRTYRYLKHKPLFAFGHGLSYANFEYGEVRSSQTELKAPIWDPKSKTWQTADTLKLIIGIRNTSKFDADEVVQIYASSTVSLWRSNQELVDFRRIHVKAGATAQLNFEIPLDRLARWDIAAGVWLTESGTYTFRIGSSSTDIRREIAVRVNGGTRVTWDPRQTREARHYDDCSGYESGITIAADSNSKFFVGLNKRGNEKAWLCYKNITVQSAGPDKVKGSAVQTGSNGGVKIDVSLPPDTILQTNVSGRLDPPDARGRIEARAGSPEGRLLATINVPDNVTGSTDLGLSALLDNTPRDPFDLYLVLSGRARIRNLRLQL